MEKVTVLFVDDNLAVTRLAESILSPDEYIVTTSNDPVQALKVVKKELFNLIVVDVIMPKMNGVEFIRKAKATEMNASSRYAILTAKKLEEEERREVFDLGVEILTKPFIPQKLVEKIGELLG